MGSRDDAYFDEFDDSLIEEAEMETELVDSFEDTDIDYADYDSGAAAPASGSSFQSARYAEGDPPSAYDSYSHKGTYDRPYEGSSSSASYSDSSRRGSGNPGPQNYYEGLQQIRKQAKEIFGHNSFRECQQGVIETTLQGKDCFVLMPTGLPMSFLRGVCLVNIRK